MKGRHVVQARYLLEIFVFEQDTRTFKMYHLSLDGFSVLVGKLSRGSARDDGGGDRARHNVQQMVHVSC